MSIKTDSSYKINPLIYPYLNRKNIFNDLVEGSGFKLFDIKNKGEQAIFVKTLLNLKKCFCIVFKLWW